MSWPFPHIDELAVSQTSRGKSQPIIIIVNFFLYLFLSVCVGVSVTEFSKVLPPFFPPPTCSSVRVGGVVVEVGGGGGTDSGT